MTDETAGNRGLENNRDFLRRHLARAEFRHRAFRCADPYGFGCFEAVRVAGRRIPVAALHITRVLADDDATEAMARSRIGGGETVRRGIAAQTAVLIHADVVDLVHGRVEIARRIVAANGEFDRGVGFDDPRMIEIEIRDFAGEIRRIDQAGIRILFRIACNLIRGGHRFLDTFAREIRRCGRALALAVIGRQREDFILMMLDRLEFAVADGDGQAAARADRRLGRAHPALLCMTDYAVENRECLIDCGVRIFHTRNCNGLPSPPVL